MSPDQDLVLILDRFPASQLHSAWRLVRAIIPLAEVNELKPLERIPVQQLAQQGFGLAQIQEAAQVLAAVHKAIYKGPDASVGVSVARLRAPQVSVDGFLIGLNSIPLHQIDEDLSKRENAAPQNTKINIRISRTGDVSIYENRGNMYPLTKKEFEYVHFIYSKAGSKRIGLKQIAAGVHATTQNASRDIGVINDNVMEKLKLKYPLIDWRKTIGYFLNTEQYNIMLG